VRGPSGPDVQGSTSPRAISDELGDLLRAITETPAPTFNEHERAELYARLLREAGLAPVRDDAGNVVAELPGGRGPRVLLAAHLDTVFAADVDLAVRTDGSRWSAPGIGDNSASLAVLAFLARHRAEWADLPFPRVTVAATVGEEGLGDLRGARALLSERKGDFDLMVAVDGHLGAIVDAAVGSKRYEIGISAAGGHSWGDFPSPSATHALGAMIHSLAGLELSREPRSSYNVGQVWGGTGVNAIAQEAGFNLDLRSVDAKALDELEKDALVRLRRVAKRQRVGLTLAKVGDRPAAAPEDRRLARIAREALAEVDLEARTTASSTDANVGMAAGLPAIAFGVYRGGDAHRMSEWLDRPSLDIGLRALLALLRRLAEAAPG
jgi:tripeptide aminopeptidase